MPIGPACILPCIAASSRFPITPDTAVRRIISSPIKRDPHWVAATRHTRAQLPAAVRPWLLDDGSLTARLINLNEGKFSVERLSHAWITPLPSERRLLDIAQRQRALVREVVLRLGTHDVVFARSVFPCSSLTGSLLHLRRLHNKSLGAYLFSQSGMQRSPFEICLLDGHHGYLPAGLRQEQPAWARRSRFELNAKSLLVSEVFLQAFKPWPNALSVHRSQRGKVRAAMLRANQ
jgi:chorismate--pyruvate lyase